jgi:AbrB family looped-hinge helix DNA binding protein
MELAKITGKGQITLPIAIRKALGLKNGDKVVFIEKDAGFMLANPTMLAFETVRKAFDGEAERLGLRDENDVTLMVKEVRKLRKEQKHARDA